MIIAPDRRMVYIILFAVTLHMLLFALVRPRTRAFNNSVVAPVTHYLVQDRSGSGFSSAEIRAVKSPVVFSLPSGMGFSRELMCQDVETRLNMLSRPELSESFLEVPVGVEHEGKIDSEELMFTSSFMGAPQVPDDIFATAVKRPAARRVNIAPQLKERLVGGVVFPSELNQEVEKAWEVRASVSISDMGQIEHVFLDEPLNSPQLNREVLRLLHSLRFKPGQSTEGHIEIYSPETTISVETGAEQ